MGPRLAATAMLVAALALGACGGDTEERNAYVDEINAAQNRFAKRFDELNTRITPTSTPQEDRRTLNAYESVVRDTLAQLRGVTPPEGLEDQHRRFVAIIADYGAAVRQAREAVVDGTAQEALTAQQRLKDTVEQITRRLNDTIADINRELKE